MADVLKVPGVAEPQIPGTLTELENQDITVVAEGDDAPMYREAETLDSQADEAVQALINDTQPAQKPSMQSSVALAIGTNPEAEVEARRVAQRTGVPVQTVFAFPEETRRKAALSEISFDKYEKMYPASALVLSDVEMAKIAHDDMDNMGYTENILRGIGQRTVNIGGGLLRLTGTIAQDLNRRTEELGIPTMLDFRNGIELRHATREELASPTGWDPLVETLEDFDLGYVPRTTWDDVKDRPLSEFLPFALEQGLVSTPDMAAAIVNMPIYALALTGGIGQNRAENDERRDATLEDFVKAAPASLTIALLERFAAKGVLGIDGAVDAFAQIPVQALKAGAKEALTEGVQNTAQYASETAGTKKGFDAVEAGEEALQGVVAGGPFGATVRSTVGTGGVLMHRYNNKARAAATAEENAADLDQLNALAAESKLKARDPLAFQNFIEQVVEQDGTVENVYVDPRALAQSGISLDALAEASPSFAEQVRVAVETGADITIPVSEYASHLAGTELGQAMVDHLKTTPLGMTRAEAREFMQGRAEAFQEDVKKTLDEANVDDTFRQSAEVVREKIGEQLQQARRFTDDVNRQYSELMASFYKVQAARLGTTPEAFFEAHPVAIQSITDTSANTLSLGQRMYHGTRVVFDRFEGSSRTSNLGTYLTGNPDFANSFAQGDGGHVRLVDFQPKKVLELESFGPFIDDSNFKPFVAQFPAKVRPLIRKAYKESQAYPGDVFTFNVLEHDPAIGDALRAAGYDAINFADWGDGAAEPATVALNPSELYQDGELRRGSFNPDTSTITLLKNADLSTFLHESGHFFLEVMNKLALTEDAPAEIKADMDGVLRWLKVEGDTPEARLAEWNKHDLEWQRERHEQFARGFEAYLFEGKSPGVEMREIFQRFRAWLLSVYRNLRNLNVELSDEVRSVFDRMLATTEQIKETELARSYEPLFADAQTAGMNGTEWQEYQELGLQATQDAVEGLEKRSMREMKWLSNAKSRALKELQNEVAGRRREVRDQATKEIMAEPVNQARQFVTRGEFTLPENANKEMRRLATEVGTGPTKLSLPALKEMYGDGPNAPWRYFNTGKYGEAGKEGLHPDIVADMFGFTSGDELVRALLAAEKPRQRIEALTDQRMLEKYGDLEDPDALARAADEAVHNEARSRFVSAELNALQRATGGKKVLATAAKDFAGRMISSLRVRDIQPSRYSVAESRAGRAAEKALRAGNLAEAAVEKRNQLIQGYASRAAHDALGEADRALRYFKKFDRNGTRDNIDADYLDQIDALLERFDLRKGQSLKAIDKRASLAEWIKSQEDIGIEPEIPQALRDDVMRKSYKDMTVEEMRGLRDTIKQIEHLGRLKNKLLTAKDKRDFKKTVEDLVASINENAGGRVVDNRTRATRAGDVKRLFKGFVAQHRKVASLARELDGIKDGGPMWEVFIRTMNEAGDKETSMRAKATQDLAKLLKPVLDTGKMGGKGVFFPTLNKSLNREERLGVALNTGNAGNLQRLLDGEGWTMDQIRPVLDSLTKDEWDFVQNTWDFFETFRPDIGAKERRVYGKEPEWIEPQAVQTPYGEYKGGYYPIKYDNRRSIAAEQHSDAEYAKQQMRGAYTSATTRRSFTKTRADEVKGRPLLYSMDGLYSGVNEIIHDLAWHEWLIDANRLLRSKSLDGAIRNGYGADVVRQFKDAVKDIAGGEMPNGTSFESAIADLRAGVVVAGLGVNIVTSVINITGLTNSVVRVGPKWVAMGVAKWAANPKGLTREVHEKSEFMRLRARTMLREINELQSQVRGKSRLRARFDNLMFAPLTITQMVVDVPTWQGAYEKALTEGNTEERAVALADQAVVDSQSGGQVKDLAAIQRSSALLKLFTTFYGYFNASYNIGVERAKATDFKDPLSVVKLAGDYLMLYSVPAVLGAIIRTAIQGDDDDWEIENLAKAVANEQISFLFGQMVGLREVSGAAQTLAGVNPYNMGYGGPAGLRFIQEFYNLAQQTSQGEADEAFRKSVVNTLGIVFKLPAAQINRTVGGIDALLEGDTENPAAILAGPPRK